MKSLKAFFNANINHDLDSLRKRWTKTVCIIADIVFLIITLTEIVVFFLFKISFGARFDEKDYLLRFFLFPLVLNGIVIVLMHLTETSKAKDGTKMYLISALFVMLVFIMNIVHCVFPVLLTTFAVPVMLSVIYSDKRLTNSIAFLSLIMEIIAEFFIVWDSDKPMPFATSTNFASVIVSFMTQIGLYVICNQILKFEIIKLKLSKDFEIERYHLMEEAMKDGLTGINNRKAFEKYIEDIAKTKLSEDSFILVMLDLDNFKKINDNIGHNEGDKALIMVAELILTETTKLNGKAFRYGGDEFVIVFRNETANDVYKICRDIREAFKDSITKEMEDLNVSLSFGMAEHSAESDFLATLKMADDQMYIYKDRHKQKK